MQLFPKQQGLLKNSIVVALALFVACEASGLLFIAMHKHKQRKELQDKLYKEIATELLHYEELTILSCLNIERNMIQLGSNHVLQQFVNLAESTQIKTTESKDFSKLRHSTVDELLDILDHNPNYVDIRILDKGANELLRANRWNNSYIVTNKPTPSWQTISNYWLFINQKNIPLHATFSRGFSYEEQAIGNDELDKIGFRLFIRIQSNNGTPFFVVLVIRVKSLFEFLPGKYQHLWHATVLDRNGFYLYDSETKATFGQLQNSSQRLNIATTDIELGWQLRTLKEGKYEDDTNFYVFRNITLPYARGEQKEQTIYSVLATINKKKLKELPLHNNIAFQFSYFLLSLFSILLATSCGAILFFVHTSQKNKNFAEPFMENMIPTIIRSYKGKVVYINKAFSSITGFSLQDLQRDDDQIKSGLHDESFYEKLWTTIKKSKEYNNEIINRNKVGGINPFYIKIKPISKNNCKPIGYIGTYIDISKQKELEQELETLTFVDPETHIPNEMFLLNKLTYQSRMVRRYGDRHDCCLAIIFIEEKLESSVIHKQEKFKEIEHFFRKTDHIALLDNEMFALLMPLTQTSEAHALLKRFWRTMTQKMQQKKIAISLGALTGIDDDQQSYEEGVFQAKKCMRDGDGVVVFSE